MLKEQTSLRWKWVKATRQSHRWMREIKRKFKSHNNDYVEQNFHFVLILVEFGNDILTQKLRHYNS